MGSEDSCIAGVFRSSGVFVPLHKTARYPYKRVFLGPDPEEVVPAMDRLAASLNEKNPERWDDVLTAAISAKFTIVTVRGFPDGNGRLSRAILNGLLRKVHFPYIMIPVDVKDEEVYSQCCKKAKRMFSFFACSYSLLNKIVLVFLQDGIFFFSYFDALYAAQEKDEYHKYVEFMFKMILKSLELYIVDYEKLIAEK